MIRLVCDLQIQTLCATCLLPGDLLTDKTHIPATGHDPAGCVVSPVGLAEECVGPLTDIDIEGGGKQQRLAKGSSWKLK